MRKKHNSNQHIQVRYSKWDIPLQFRTLGKNKFCHERNISHNLTPSKYSYRSSVVKFPTIFFSIHRRVRTVVISKQRDDIKGDNNASTLVIMSRRGIFFFMWFWQSIYIKRVTIRTCKVIFCIIVNYPKFVPFQNQLASCTLDVKYLFLIFISEVIAQQGV